MVCLLKTQVGQWPHGMRGSCRSIVHYIDVSYWALEYKKVKEHNNIYAP
jgi:hypothetical protein